MKRKPFSYSKALNDNISIHIQDEFGQMFI